MGERTTALKPDACVPTLRQVIGSLAADLPVKPQAWVGNR
jgi:hypothetical protein